jgi:hypothetical protein
MGYETSFPFKRHFLFLLLLVRLCFKTSGIDLNRLILPHTFTLIPERGLEIGNKFRMIKVREAIGVPCRVVAIL